MTLVPPSSARGASLSLPGATGATRYVGATTTGVPTSGTFAVGDYVIAQTEGRVYVCTAAGSPGTWVDAAQDPLLKALGSLTWNYNIFSQNGGNVVTSQTLYAVLVPTIAGVTYTGVRLNVSQAGTSTAPSAFYVGLATTANIGSTGTMLAQSSDLHASSSLTTIGVQSFAFNATYTETVTGLRYVLILQNGAFAGSALNFGRISGVQTGTTGTLSAWASAGTAVASLQANGNALANAYSAASAPIAWWTALY